VNGNAEVEFPRFEAKHEYLASTPDGRHAHGGQPEPTIAAPNADSERPTATSVT
jgi:hypothetical protein